MRTVSVLIVTTLFVVCAPDLYAQEAKRKLLDEYSYKVVSSSTTGVAPTSGRKYNIKLGERCRMKKALAKPYVTALADSIYGASDHEKVAVFLYMQKMDTADGAYARAFVENGTVTEQSVEEYIVNYNDDLKALPVCD